jgi:NADPH-dependent dioxygenase
MTAPPPRVLIVGGGAAGTMLHLELARRGVRARNVDRLPGPAATSRAITIHARMAEIFDRIDRRLLDRYLARALPANGYDLHFVDDAGTRSTVRAGLDFTLLDCRYPCLFVHGQHETEQTLRDFMHEEFGATTEWGVELIDIDAVPGSVRARLRHADGRVETVETEYLVACDGTNSRVRRQLRLVQDESDYKGSVMQNLDVFLNHFPDRDDRIHYCVGRGHFLMLAKLPGGYHRLLLSDRGEAAAPDVTPEQAFMRLIDQHFDGVSLGKVVWHSKWESWVRLAHTYRHQRVFLAGDSAHVHSTSGGQGMNCCMQDAFNLGWKLAMVLQGQARATLLDTYETERKPIAEQVIWAASSLHEIFMGHGQSIAARTARISDPAFLRKVVGHCSGIDYTYRDPAAQDASNADARRGPRPGDRAPDVDFPDGTTLFGKTRHVGFSLLLVPGDTEVATDPAGLVALASRFGQVLRTHALPTCPDLTRRYGRAAQAQLFLVRPDGHVAARSPVRDPRSVQEYLERVLVNC